MVDDQSKASLATATGGSLLNNLHAVGHINCDVANLDRASAGIECDLRLVEVAAIIRRLPDHDVRLGIQQWSQCCLLEDK